MKKSSKSVWSRFVMTFAAAFLLMLVTTVPVKADSSNMPLVKDIKQTDASTNSVGITWSCPGSDIRFKIETSEQLSTGYTDYNKPFLPPT